MNLTKLRRVWTEQCPTLSVLGQVLARKRPKFSDLGINRCDKISDDGLMVLAEKVLYDRVETRRM
eukprot:6481577-Amphidinium_carterae.2